MELGGVRTQRGVTVRGVIRKGYGGVRVTGGLRVNVRVDLGEG